MRIDSVPASLKRQQSENGFNFGVDRDMRCGNTVNRKLLAVGLREMEEAADVVVLVVGGKQALDFGVAERECGERDGPAKFAGLGTIVAHQFAQRHDGSASRFSAHGILLGKGCSRRPQKELKKSFARKWPTWTKPSRL